MSLSQKADEQKLNDQKNSKLFDKILFVSDSNPSSDIKENFCKFGNLLQWKNEPNITLEDYDKLGHKYVWVNLKLSGAREYVKFLLSGPSTSNYSIVVVCQGSRSQKWVSDLAVYSSCIVKRKDLNKLLSLDPKLIAREIKSLSLEVSKPVSQCLWFLCSKRLKKNNQKD